MTSQKQIDSNRENAQKSTGANTEAGQAVSRMNAVTHGGYTKDPVLPWENRAEFEALKLEFYHYYGAKSILQKTLVDMLTDVVWRRRRIAPQEARLWQQFEDEPALLNEHLDRLDKLDSRLQSKFERLRRELEALDDRWDDDFGDAPPDDAICLPEGAAVIPAPPVPVAVEPSASSPAQGETIDPAELEEEMNILNQHRSSYGLPPVTLEEYKRAYPNGVIQGGNLSQQVRQPQE